MPKAKLSSRADRRIKFRLYRIMVEERLIHLFRAPFNVAASHKPLAFALTVLALFVITTFYAYASESVSPGNAIYPLKTALEKIEQKAAASPAAKIAVYEKLSQRRLQEAVNLSQKADMEDSEDARQNIKRNVEENIASHSQVVNYINSLNDPEASAAILEAEQKDEEELEYLKKIAEYAQKRQDAEVLQAANEALEIISRQEYKDREDKHETEEYRKEPEQKEAPEDNLSSGQSDGLKKEDSDIDGEEKGDDSGQEEREQKNNRNENSSQGDSSHQEIEDLNNN